MPSQPAVLFVCLGNICRSPLAEAAFRKAANEAGLSCLIDSAGTGPWHIGKAPDPRSQEVALRHGIDISEQRARQLAEGDYTRFTHIFAMDRDNLRTIRMRAPRAASAQVGLLLDILPGPRGRDVDDPYYGGPDGFERTFAEVSEAARTLAKGLLGEF